MEIGMLWFDNSKDDLSKKIGRAVEHYLRKYNRKPDTCYVHLKVIDKQTQVGGILVIPYKSILLNHYWLGIEDKQS